MRSSGFSHCYNWNSLERKPSFSNEYLLCIVPPKLLGAIMGCCVKLSVVLSTKCQLLCGDCSYGCPGINSHHPGRGLSS